MITPSQYDVAIIGAGAAGLMCAQTAGQRGKRVLLLDHVAAAGEKIRISGGGRCNFTNLHTTPKHFLSDNPHFCISALKRYTPQDFISLVERHRIAYHEKTLGQLFCDGSSQQIIQMLLDECARGKVELVLGMRVTSIQKCESGFHLVLAEGAEVVCQSLVLASGGLSIPKMGATGFGYEVARQFGLNIIPTRAALVPFTLADEMLAHLKPLAGVAVPHVLASCAGAQFEEAMLFTHRGLSGPATLQISSYWREDAEIAVNFMPQQDVFSWLKRQKALHPRQEVMTVLAQVVPKRFAHALCGMQQIRGTLADSSHESLQRLAQAIQHWRITPAGTEGYRTAEVTLGGVDTRQLSSQTMECTQVKGLYFVGEVVDVTGHLGGFNFQWAWASGHAAGQAV